jgi:hypothetical protein
VWSVVGSLVALLALVYGAWITLDTILHGTDLQAGPRWPPASCCSRACS